MKRFLWLPLSAALALLMALLSFAPAGSAELPRLPTKTLPKLTTPAPTPKLELPKFPIRTLPKLATPKPTFPPIKPKVTLPIVLPTPRPSEDPGIAVAATTMPGLNDADAPAVWEVADGSALNLDGSGPVAVSLTWDTDEYGYGQYALTAGAAGATGDCESLVYRLYAGQLAGPDGPTYLIVPDLGPSDDPMSYIYRYSDGGLHYLGGVPALPDAFTLTADGLTTTIRAAVLHTWFRPADFRVEPAVHEIRRDLYPMGAKATLLRKLPLRASRAYGTKPALTLEAGAQVVLAATDDLEWVYVVMASDSAQGGWLRLIDQYYCDVGGGKQAEPTELFDGLLMAD
ncbi:MAG: hypothetical protein GX558_01725 [Clostridiales bacterium]|nr:hypothetical protein [Clostridiales bacterium]